jgi:hypothetical protein
MPTTPRKLPALVVSSIVRKLKWDYGISPNGTISWAYGEFPGVNGTLNPAFTLLSATTYVDAGRP